MKQLFSDWSILASKVVNWISLKKFAKFFAAAGIKNAPGQAER